ncbi:MAG: SHOCT domain-containing protein [Actinomycetia bacterium]|nr:SHOCT domain-containing protein [Actinomycetes bacterium]
MMYGFGLWAPMGFLIMASVIGLVIWAIAGVTRSESRVVNGTTATDVLADRYARGEIDDAEYQMRRSVIEGSI